MTSLWNSFHWTNDLTPFPSDYFGFPANWSYSFKNILYLINQLLPMLLPRDVRTVAHNRLLLITRLFKPANSSLKMPSPEKLACCTQVLVIWEHNPDWESRKQGRAQIQQLCMILALLLTRWLWTSGRGDLHWIQCRSYSLPAKVRLALWRSVQFLVQS